MRGLVDLLILEKIMWRVRNSCMIDFLLSKVIELAVFWNRKRCHSIFRNCGKNLSSTYILMISKKGSRTYTTRITFRFINPFDTCRNDLVPLQWLQRVGRLSTKTEWRHHLERDYRFRLPYLLDLSELQKPRIHLIIECTHSSVRVRHIFRNADFFLAPSLFSSRLSFAIHRLPNLRWSGMSWLPQRRYLPPPCSLPDFSSVVDCTMVARTSDTRADCRRCSLRCWKLHIYWIQQYQNAVDYKKDTILKMARRQYHKSLFFAFAQLSR